MLVNEKIKYLNNDVDRRLMFGRLNGKTQFDTISTVLLQQKGK